MAALTTTGQPGLRGWRPFGAFVIVVVLVLATVYEASLALGVFSIGKLPGEGAPGAGLAAAVGSLAMLAGLVVAASSVKRPEAIARTVRLLLALAAAGFVVSAYFTPDPYFAPNLRRYSEGGAVPAYWMLLLSGAAVAVAVLSSIRPNEGMLTTAVVLLACMITLFFMGTGH